MILITGDAYQQCEEFTYLEQLELDEIYFKAISKELAVAWILCSRLHAYLSTQSLLMAMLHSLIARRRFGPQTQWRPLRVALTSGLGLDDMSLAWPAVVQLLVFIYSGIQ